MDEYLARCHNIVGLFDRHHDQALDLIRLPYHISTGMPIAYRYSVEEYLAISKLVNTIQFGAAETISKSLRKAGISFRFQKSAALTAYFPDIAHLGIPADIDLICEDRAKAAKVLANIGYEAGVYDWNTDRINLKHERALDHTPSISPFRKLHRFRLGESNQKNVIRCVGHPLWLNGSTVTLVVSCDLSEAEAPEPTQDAPGKIVRDIIGDLTKDIVHRGRIKVRSIAYLAEVLARRPETTHTINLAFKDAQAKVAREDHSDALTKSKDVLYAVVRTNSNLD